jgi:glycogen phosphorylase
VDTIATSSLPALTSFDTLVKTPPDGLSRELPEPIARLDEVAHNLWWSWSPEARQLFRAISVTLWRATDHNPVRMLRLVTQDRLEKIARDQNFLKQYTHLLRSFDRYLTSDDTTVAHRYAHRYAQIHDKKIAYFSAEYGLHGSLPVYSGGLGILAGDHCKTASDLGLDFRAVGFMYPRGYFEQEITTDGEQIADYRQISIPDVAIERAFLKSGEPVIVALPLENPAEPLYLQVWLVRCGRMKIYLIDSDLDLNQPWNREISTRLYGGDREYRLRQEIALGVGGVRVLRALGVAPDVWHANEGHVAFMLLERLREAVKSGMSFEYAKEFVRSTTIFTTHTPVPAGHDAFDFDMMERYFSHYWLELGITKEQFMDLGRHSGPDGEAFNMTALSMTLSGHRNAVSVKHREVTANMWPEFVTDNTKLLSVTNGVHIGTWLAPEMEELFTQELGKDWSANLNDEKYWAAARDMPDAAVWQTRQMLKTSLFSFITDRVRRKWLAEGLDPSLFVASGMLLDPRILTIGFARRFATYKRATLIFKDLERLKKLLSDPLRPVQFIFSGKAHPADEGGKQMIREIWQYAKDPEFGGRIAFVENYGMHVAKYLVRGVDVWMNNPQVPLEASGTSGMKAGINGVPNFSILDGWWLEGWNGKNGWGLEGSAIDYIAGVQNEEQDQRDAGKMYDTLSDEIIPLFYDKQIDGIPHNWVKVVKESIATIVPKFSTERMMGEYISSLYVPASTH